MSRFLKGVGALLVLGGILVGVPALLIVLAGNPFPTGEQLHAMVSLTPDYGNVILTTKLLPLAAWAAWLAFAGPFLLEIGASLRGRASRKRWAPIRGQQRLAAALIGAVVLMFASPAFAAAPTAQAADLVASGIVAIDPGVTASPSTLSVGPTVADIPASAPAGQPFVELTPAVDQQQVIHVVGAGDTLWDISEQYYNDGTRYPEIFDANSGAVQPDATTLSDADLIQPGWELTIPGVYAQAAPASPAEATPPVPPPAPEPDQQASTTAQPPVDSASPGGGGAGAGGAAETTTGRSGGSSTDAGSSTTLEPTNGDVEPSIPLMTVGGVTALLAFGLLAALGRRRLRQRRRRAVGERVAMPEGAAADYELEMRMVENPIGVDDVDNALRALQAWAEDEGEQLPELLAVRVANDEVALYLAAPAQLPAPFESQALDGTAWIVRPGAATPPARPTMAPYPGLATIGVDDQGGLLLLDIEQIGSLNIVGDDDTVQGVLNALACEFATNPWSELIQVTLVGVRSGFAGEVDRRRIRHVDDVTALIRNLRGELDNRREALDSFGVSGVLEGRTRASELETWPPHIVILGELPAKALREELAGIVARMPRMGIATISNGAVLIPGATVRIASADHAEYFSGDSMTPLPFRPQLLAGEELALVQSLFATTSQDAHPADLDQEHSRGLDAADDAQDPSSIDTPPDRDVDDETTLASSELEASTRVLDEAVQPATEAALRTLAPASLDEVDELEASPASRPLTTNDTLEDTDTPDWPVPYLRVMGPPDASGLADSDVMPGRGVEFLALLLLQTGAVSGGFIQSKMWPDSVAKRNQNTSSLATQVRQALGSDPAGNPLLPEGSKHDGFTSHPSVRLDWHEFCDLIGPDLTTTPNMNLVRALRLVRGEPFDGTRLIRGRWQWTAPYIEIMRAAVLDAADELAHRALRADQHSQARFAARMAQATDPLNEAGWRLEIETAMRAGDADAFNRVVDDMYSCVGGPDIEIDDATQALINQAHSTMPGLLAR